MVGLANFRTALSPASNPITLIEITFPQVVFLKMKLGKNPMPNLNRRGLNRCSILRRREMIRCRYFRASAQRARKMNTGTTSRRGPIPDITSLCCW